MIITKTRNLLFLSVFLLFLSCNEATEKKTDTINIVAGTSRITGNITSPPDQNKGSIIVTIIVRNPISGENVRHEILADQSGNFSFDYDIETETTVLSFFTSVSPYKMLYMKANNKGTTHIDIEYNSNRDIKNVEVSPAINKYDMMQTMGVLNKMIDYIPNDPNWKPLHFYNKSIDEFWDYARNDLPRKMALFVNNDQELSEEFKDLIAKDYRLYWYTEHVFAYEASMKHDYRNATGDTVNIPNTQKPDRSYFRFLKDFNLNDPQYLHTFTFPEFQDSILNNEVLALPAIGESDILSWLASAKGILAESLGFDEGPYYDILAANAYGQQLNEQRNPLTDKQKEHITDYWENGEIAKILFRKNRQIVELQTIFH